MQSLRKGRDRQCRTNPIDAVTAMLVRIAPPLYTGVGVKKGSLCRTRALPAILMMAPRRSRDHRFQMRGWSAGTRCSNVIRQPSVTPIGSFAGKKWDSRYKGESASSCEGGYTMETIVIVLLVLFLLGGGGWGYSRWRR